jgi:polysaccharide export outer membrane protein
MLWSELEARYARELAEPEVQLTPLVRVSVLGEVRNPGLFLVDPTHVIRDVIALAGGLTPSANRRRVRITRGASEVVAEYEAGAAALEAGVRSGDEIFVDRRSWLGDNLGIFIGAAASVAVAAVTSWIVR